MRLDTRFLLIRHAHVAPASRSGPLCGWYDVPLSSIGRAQLTTLRHRQPRIAPADALYTSPLARAEATAEALGEIWRLDTIRHSGLREIFRGTLEGVPIADIEDRCAELWSRNLVQIDDQFAWPGGESYVTFRFRVLSTIDSIVQRHVGQRVALVTHAGVINQVIGHAEGRRPAEWSAFQADPLSVTEIVWNSGRPSLGRFNEPI